MVENQNRMLIHFSCRKCVEIVAATNYARSKSSCDLKEKKQL